MALWFVTERPVVGRVFVAHRDGLVLATKLADPPEGKALGVEDFVGYMRRKFGAVVEHDQGPASPWPFNETRGPFQATDLVDLSRLTDFQRRVMMATARIPPGRLRTYGEVADELEHSKAAVAVGQAMKSNPAPLVIPCHRVVAKGDLGGWVYGRDLKRELLAHEEVPLRSGSVHTGIESPTAVVVPSVPAPPSLEQRLKRGESQRMEFKSTAGRSGWRKGQHEIVASVCGFLNADGGELIIGVGDDGRPKGLSNERPRGKPFDADDFERFIWQLLELRLTIPTTLLVSIHFPRYGGRTVCVVAVEPSPNDAVFAQPLDDDNRSWGSPDRSGWEFFVRVGNATRRYSGPDLANYLRRRFPTT